MTFKELFALPFWELVLLAIKDDIVLALRAWAICFIIGVILIVKK